MVQPTDKHSAEVDIALDDAEHIDLPFDEAASNQPWPDQKFIRSVAEALDVVARHAHIQVYLKRETAGDIEHATLRKNFDPFLVFPFTEYQEGQPHRWSSYDDMLVSERADNGNSDFTALQSMKYRLRDYPDAVEALSVLQQVALREKEWKDAVRASTTPEQSHEMYVRFRKDFDARDYVVVPHSEVSNSPRAQLARMKEVGMKMAPPPKPDIILP